MLVKSVELKNIKSYRHEIIEFREGINGICGMNGHGKTTILEAIGYVLFDYLPYSEKDFKRRGENSAYVIVEVIQNGALYILTKKLGGEFTVRGQDVNITGKKEALFWISHNLFPFSGLDELPGIFENAIGVPQGMFTAAFINPPAKRKKIFDEILKVEEYRKAYEDFRDTMALIDKEISDIENEIKGLCIRTEGYDRKKDERDKLKEALGSLKNNLKEYARDLNSKKIILEELKKQKKELDKLNNGLIQLKERLKMQNQQLKKNREEFSRSEKAQEIISDLSSMKEIYEGAGKNLERLEGQRKIRENLLDKLNKIQTDLSLLADKKKRMESLFVEIEKKKKDKDAISQLVDKQSELEKKKEEAKQNHAVVVKEIEDIKNRMNISGVSGDENLCPVIKGVRCSSVKDFSEYFKDQIEVARNKLKHAVKSVKLAELELNELGDPRNRVNGLDILINNHNEEIAGFKRQIEGLPEKEKSENALRMDLEKYGNLDGEIADAKGKIREFEPLYRKYLLNQSIAARAAEYRKECDTLQKSLEEGEEKHREFQKQIIDTGRSFSENDLVQKQKEYEEAGARIRGIEVEIREKESQLKKLNHDISEMEKYLSGISDLEAKLENEKHFRDYAKFIREMLRDSGQKIVVELIGEIEEEANNLYCAIMDDFSQELRWSEDYEIRIIDSGESKIFQQLSGGEKMGAALAVRLAILKILSNSDFVFLDEPTQNMDELRREKLSREITKICGFKQIFVISHDDTFNEKYANIIRIEKQDGESRVVPCSI